MVVAAFEGQFSVKESIKYNSTSPYINAAIDFVVLLVGKALRGHVGETASVKVFLGEEVNGPSNSEVNDLHLLLLAVHQQDVLKL